MIINIPDQILYFIFGIIVSFIGSYIYGLLILPAEYDEFLEQYEKDIPKNDDKEIENKKRK